MGRQLRVLIIEDEQLTALSTEVDLQALGYEVFGVAASLETALEAVHADGFDVAILDLNLDGQPADAVAEELARQEIPFVVASAYPSTADAPEPLRQAPRVEKPYRGEHLHRAIAGLHLT